MALRPVSHNLLAVSSAVCALLLTLVWPFPDGPSHLAHAKTDRSELYALSKARTLARVISHIRTHYVAPERVNPKEMAVAALEVIQFEVPEVRFTLTRSNDKAQIPETVRVLVGQEAAEFALDSLDDLYKLNWKLMEIFGFLESSLPIQVDLEGVEYAAINGLLSTLDPHTLLLPPRVYREMQLSQRGRFGGLGVTVGEVDGNFVVQQVLAEGPAAAAGIKLNDQIVQIDGESTAGLTLDEAVSLMRGEVNTEVTIWVKRPALSNPAPIRITRREIQMPSVDSYLIEEGIGWIHLRVFQDGTSRDVEQVLSNFENHPGGLKGLILDLRDNPGGLLEEALKVSDLFLNRGTIVTTIRGGGKERSENHATQRATRADLPLVVLVDRNSASASEIVAGALKYNQRAIILGQRTFGKGSVQVIYRIDDAALKMTISQYLTPGDLSIQGVGIVPDIELASLRVPESRRNDAPFDGRIELRPPLDDVAGEATLFSALSSQHTRQEQPNVRLQILEELRMATFRQNGDMRAPDASVKLARDLLTAGLSKDRKQSLAKLGAFLERRGQEENTKLEKALAPLHVDWRRGPKLFGKPTLQVSLQRKNAEQALRPGEAFTLELKIKNTGKRPLYRLHAELQSELSSIHGREIPIGYLEAGASMTRSIQLSVPLGTHHLGDLVRAQLYADSQALPLAPHVELSIAPNPPPVLTYSAQLDDRPREGSELKGNGDGLIQRGERVELELWLHNLGTGSAGNVIATLHNETGPDLFLHSARQEVGALQPREVRPIRFSFEVRPSLRTRLVTVGLELRDAASGEWTGELDLEFPVYPSELPPRQEAAGLARVSEENVFLFSGAHIESPMVAALPQGSALQLTGKVGDWFEVAFAQPANAQQSVRRAFVPSNRITWEATGTAQPLHETFVHFQPPQLALESLPTFSSEPTLHVRGQALYADPNAARRLVYAFLNEQKVFFQEAFAGTNPHSFETQLTLEPGPNVLVIYAQEGPLAFTRRVHTIYHYPNPTEGQP